ncbi:SLC26A1 [Acanthosepion pharaonis]|uniref:SLC26A1 n=1 Tax=Acanthosepion pharaonis TaxID=158019 RepID=A0A812CV38_ACAPH|nr:SLC26A1 [Sepia pharaonis]
MLLYFFLPFDFFLPFFLQFGFFLSFVSFSVSSLYFLSVIALYVSYIFPSMFFSPAFFPIFLFLFLFSSFYLISFTFLFILSFLPSFHPVLFIYISFFANLILCLCLSIKHLSPLFLPSIRFPSFMSFGSFASFPYFLLCYFISFHNTAAMASLISQSKMQKQRPPLHISQKYH